LLFSTDIGDNIFGDSVQNSFYINLCVDVFGAKYDYTYVKKQVKATLDKYGGRTNYDVNLDLLAERILRLTLLGQKRCGAERKN
jgi:hypothetical protein